jgi:alpha-glucosidase
MARTDLPWWRSAAIYQVYIRSFADGSGDGVGDIAGLRRRLPHLRDLGLDALWINPWYVSPMVDAGYDVADYCAIDPLFGTLAEAGDLIGEAHALGLRVIVDIVPNHCSDRHPWFQAALAAQPGSRERARFWFRPGRGPDGAEPPNDWPSHFGGSAWQRVPDGEWYLHLFAPEQPDFNWTNPEVHAEFERILRFWLDRGVDGFRIDVANALAKKAGLPDEGPRRDPANRPFEDQPAVHEVWREWRRVVDNYPGERMLVGEVWSPSAERLARYLRPDELHTAFNFDCVRAPWEAASMRALIDGTLAAHALVGAPPTWVLSNHDVTRHVTRYGRARTGFELADRQDAAPADLALGRRRARAAALLTMALPGGVYVYQGDELGLEEVEDIPEELLQDPFWARTGHEERGRDGCRVPIPWSGEAPPFAFGPDGTWLPQPPAWRALTVEAQTGDPASQLELYRAALHLRRTEDGLGDGPFAWLPSAPEVLAFTRGPRFACVVNLGREPVELAANEELLLTSLPLEGGGLPADATAWLRP